MAGGLTGEDERLSDDLGQLNYQESKVFSGETYLVNVYVHEKRQTVTFETYGLDSQDALRLEYAIADFDTLFRFNAELMNPNRKEGRYHWVIARLDIVLVGKENKLQLGGKQTEEVAQVPQYETHRKIPTGRMDLKERQRLREQMDMLEIRRAENILKKRQANKERFLQRLFLMKEEDEQKRKAVQAKIEQEQAMRFELKAQKEEEEAQEFKRLQEMKEQRIARVEVKEQRTEEQDEEEYRLLRQRWREKDAQEAQAYKEKKAARKVELEARAKAEWDREVQMIQVQEKREKVWKARANRIAEKEKQVIRKLLEVKERLRREEQIVKDRNAEFVKQLRADRQLVWEAQLQRTKDREAAFFVEEEKVAKYYQERALPKKVKTKGRFSAAEMARKEALEREAAAGGLNATQPLASPLARIDSDDVEADLAEGEEATNEGDDGLEAAGLEAAESIEAGEPAEGKKTPKKSKTPKGAKSRKSSVGRKSTAALDAAAEPDPAKSILDEVDAKMRAELEMQERRALKQKQREQRIEKRKLEREEREKERMKAYRAQIREKEAAQEMRAAQQRVIMKQRDQEQKDAEERQKQDMDRLNRLRENNIVLFEARRREKLESK